MSGYGAAAGDGEAPPSSGGGSGQKRRSGEAAALLLPDPPPLVVVGAGPPVELRPTGGGAEPAAGAAPDPPPPAPASPAAVLTKGLLLRAAVCVICAGLALIPRLSSWRAHLTLATFLFVMPGLMLLREVPGVVLVVFGLGVLAVSTAMPSPGANNTPWYGMARDVTWLCIFAVHLASAVTSSGLGRRLALTLMRYMGSSILGVAYAVVATELALGPVVPANTARAACLAPVLTTLIAPLHDTAQRQFIVLVATHANILISAFYATGMSGNEIPIDAIKEHLNIDYSWGDWILDSCVPGGLCLVLLPFYLKLLVRPAPLGARVTALGPTATASGDGDADPRVQAAHDLRLLGPAKRDERVTGVVLFVLLILFATNDKDWGTGVDTASACLAGVCLLLASRVLTIDQILVDKKAWMMLLFLGGILSFVHALQVEEVVDWFAKGLEKALDGVEGPELIIGLGVLYYYSMYFFSMLNGHAAALIDPFLAVVALAGAPPQLAAAVFAAFTSLCAALTHYSTGSTIIYFALGEVPVRKWLAVGFAVSIFHMAVWLGGGMLYWHLLGHY